MFFAFGTAQVSFIQLSGSGTGIAIVLDATVIRGLLVPPTGQPGPASIPASCCTR